MAAEQLVTVLGNPAFDPKVPAVYGKVVSKGTPRILDVFRESSIYPPRQSLVLFILALIEEH